MLKLLVILVIGGAALLALLPRQNACPRCGTPMDRSKLYDSTKTELLLCPKCGHYEVLGW